VDFKFKNGDTYLYHLVIFATDLQEYQENATDQQEYQEKWHSLGTHAGQWHSLGTPAGL
jgi:hypothetical protein